MKYKKSTQRYVRMYLGKLLSNTSLTKDEAVVLDVLLNMTLDITEAKPRLLKINKDVRQEISKMTGYNYRSISNTLTNLNKKAILLKPVDEITKKDKRGLYIINPFYFGVGANLNVEIDEEFVKENNKIKFSK